MSEAEAAASEIVQEAQGGEDETQAPISEPDTGGAEVQEPDSGQSEVVADGPTQAERAAFSRQFANLARQERRFREEKQEFKGIKKKASEMDSLQELANSDPMAFLSKFGINYDALTRRVINDGNPAIEDVVAAQAKEIAQLKELNARRDQERQERQAQREYEQTYNGFIDKIKNFVDNNNQYEMIAANNAYHTVYEVMQEKFKQDGTVLEYNDAADMVERYYEEEAERYFKSSKLRDRYKGYWQPEPEEAQDVKPSQPATKPRPKTLSNQLTSQTPARDGELLSREESLARAAAIMRGEV